MNTSMDEKLRNLPIELIEPILVHSICAFPRLLLPSDQAAVATVLNVLSYDAAPTVTYAVIHKMPHLRMEDGARTGNVHLLNVMLDMAKTRPLQYNQDQVVRLAIEQGHLEVLDWWVSRGFSLGNKVFSYSQMPQFPSAQVREWCPNHGFVFYPFERQYDWDEHREYSTVAQTCALTLSSKGLLYALEWWRKDYPRTLDSTDVDATQCFLVAMCCGHMEVAHWWLKNAWCGCLDPRVVHRLASEELDFSQPQVVLSFHEQVVGAVSNAQAILHPLFVAAIAGGQLELAKLCFQHPLFESSRNRRHKLAVKRESDWLYSLAATGGHIHVLDWLYSNNFRLARLVVPRLSDLRRSYRNGHFLAGMLKWMCPSIASDYISQRNLLDLVSYHGHVAVLDWFVSQVGAHSFQRFYTHHAMSLASGKGHIEVLDWWFSSGLELKYTTAAVERASNDRCLPVLSWWFKSGLFDKRGDVQDPFRNLDTQAAWLWCGSYCVFDGWIKTTNPSTADLDMMAAKLGYLEEHYIIEWFRRHHDSPTLLPSLTKGIAEPNQYSVRIGPLTVSLTYEHVASIPQLTASQFSWLAHRGDTVLLDRLRRLYLLPGQNDTCRTHAMIDSLSRCTDPLMVEELQRLGVLSQPVNLDHAIEADYYHVSASGWSIATLDWLVRSGHTLEWTGTALFRCTQMAQVHLLDWWARSGLELRVSHDFVLANMHQKEEEEDMRDGHFNSVAETVTKQWWREHSDLVLHYMPPDSE